MIKHQKSIGLNDQEKILIEAVAEKLGLSFASFMRSAILERANKIKNDLQINLDQEVISVNSYS